MTLSKISKNNELEEKNVQKTINRLIDNYESFYFNAGAGAGKTHALRSTLQYILEKDGDALNERKEKIMCITYTNTAKDEIKSRLGNNEQVVVSTIHEQIWSLIRIQQPVLVNLHKEKIEDEILRITNFLRDDKKAEFYRKLENKDIFDKTVTEESFMEEFYKSYNLNAIPFRKNMEHLLTEFDSSVLNNYSNFKNVVSKINKYNRLQQALELIVNKKLKKVYYTEKNNRDSLENMRISHDTLLLYGEKIVEKYDLFCKYIIDKFPIILVDEYQDTDHSVARILQYVHQYSVNKNIDFLVGYFGDTAQNIYSKGVGEDIFQVHPNLKFVNKRFNRRSTQEVIDVINLIRNDDIKQESIYEDSNDGSVELYSYSSSEEDGLDERLSKIALNYYNKFTKGKGKFACLVLRNETIADRVGFKKFYTAIKGMPRFAGAGYKNITNELLSNNHQNLGYFILNLKNMIEFIELIKDQKNPINRITGYFINKAGDVSFTEISRLIRKVNEVRGETIEEWLTEILNEINIDKNFGKYMNVIFKEIFNIDKVSLDSIKVIASNYFKIDSENEDHNTLLSQLFSMKVEELSKWNKYISNVHEDGIVYKTFHGSKGEEFDNVLVFLEDQFANRKNYFSYFLSDLDKNEDGNYHNNDKRWVEARNLLYVACSRAKVNLRVVILDYDKMEQSAQEGIKTIFGKDKIDNYELL